MARNAILNSNDWYDNYLRQSRPNEQYLYLGGNFGGPLPLPFTSFNHNRDKLFFFAGFEYDHQVFEANQQAISSWVPTAAERQGDFSASSLNTELCGSRPDGNPNPDSIQQMCFVDSFLPNGTPVANNNANNVPLNGSGQALVNWFPAPNADPFTNPFGYNYIKQLQQSQPVSLFRSTLQYNINSNNNLFLVYGLQREIDEDPVALGYFPTGGVPYPGDITTGDVSNVLSARYTRFFGSSVTNELSAAMSFVSLPGKMGNPLAVDRFEINKNTNLPNNGGLGFDYLGAYKNNNDYSVPAIANGAGNGYPNVLMPGGFYQQPYPHQEGRSDCSGQRELGGQKPLPSVRLLWRARHLQRHRGSWRLSPGRVHFQPWKRVLRVFVDQPGAVRRLQEPKPGWQPAQLRRCISGKLL